MNSGLRMIQRYHGMVLVLWSLCSLCCAKRTWTGFQRRLAGFALSETHSNIEGNLNVSPIHTDLGPTSSICTSFLLCFSVRSVTQS